MMEHMDQQPSHEDIKPLWAYNQVKYMYNIMFFDA